MAIRNKCFANLLKKYGDKLSPEELLNIYSTVEKELASSGGNVKNVSEAIAKNTTELSLIDKRNKLINARAKMSILKHIGSFKDANTGLRALLIGNMTNAPGSKLSADGKTKAIIHDYLGGFINDLEKDNLLEVFTKGVSDRDIAKELWEIREGGNPGLTKNETARKIAAVVNKYQSNLLKRLNDAGAWITPLPGYIVRQANHPIKLRKAGFSKWKDFMMANLDEKTFKGEEPEKFLRSAYEAITSGVRFEHIGENMSDAIKPMFAYSGPGNWAKRLSENRVFHFKDSDSWFEYNKQFGNENLREAVIGGIQSSAKDVALMETFGTNPEAMFNHIVDVLKKQNRNNPELVDKLKSSYNKRLFDEIAGNKQFPENLTAAKIGASIRALNNISKLGGILLSAFTDIPFQVAELRYQGMPLFSSYGRVFKNFFRGIDNPMHKEVGRLIGVGFDGIIGDAYSRFDGLDSIPGTLSKLQQKFFKLNGMSWWDSIHRTGMAHIMSNDLASKANLRFDDLPAATKNLLPQYNISKTDWDLIRSTAYKGGNNESYITPDRIADILDGDIKSVLPLVNDTAKFKRELEVKLRTFFIDRIDSAIFYPRAAEKVFAKQGTNPGTAVGEAMRFIMQFKMFPVTVVHRGLGRDILGHSQSSITEALKSGKADILGITHFMAASTMFGYFALAAKDIAKGREPRNPNDRKVIMASLAQGGGLGLYGDFIFGEYNRHGSSMISSLAGPTLGQIDDLADIWTRVRNGDDASAQSLRLIANNLPYSNLFYTKAAVDYLFMYQLQEMVNPGYLKRLERNMRKNNGQKFFIPPSSVISRGGQGGLFEAVR